MTAHPARLLRHLVLPLAMLLSAMPSSAADEPPTVELSAEGRARAPNDLATAQAYVEHTGPNAAAVAREVNRVVAQALETAGKHPKVEAKSAGTSTWPVYGKGERRITGWRMRSTVEMQSTDVAALSALVGELQETMAIASLQLQPAPESLSRAEDEAIRQALAAFEQRARMVAESLGKSHRIKQLRLGTESAPPLFRARVMTMEADMPAGAPAPLEAGESTVVVHANGTIELLD